MGILHPPTDGGAILIADDNASVRQLVALSVEGLGREILTAVDGDEAWRLLLAHRPALAVLDVRMPGRDGLELVRAIRARPALSGLRVILLSANAAAGLRDAALVAGADRYVVKPFSPHDLRNVVRDLLDAPSG